jgi:hypothetical protein
VRNQLLGGLRLCADADILYPAAKLFLKTLLPGSAKADTQP